MRSPWVYPQLQFVVFSPDSASLVADINSPTMTIWDARTGKQRSGLRGLDSNLTFLGFSSDGKRLLTAVSTAEF